MSEELNNSIQAAELLAATGLRTAGLEPYVVAVLEDYAQGIKTFDQVLSSLESYEAGRSSTASLRRSPAPETPTAD